MDGGVGRHVRRVLLLRRLVAASAISAVGDGLALVAFPLLALRVTHSALLVSGVAVASRLPWLLLGLPAGVLVDRHNKRRLVVAVDLLRALAVGLVALGAATGPVSLVALYAAAFLVGAGDTVVLSVARGTVPELVQGEGLVRVNGQVSAVETAGKQFAGPAAGGAVFALSSALPFLGDALSYLGSALLLGTAIPSRPARRTDAPPSVAADISSGLRLFVRIRGLPVLAAVVGSFAFCQAMVLGVLVLYATRVLGLDSTGYGLLLAVAAVGDVGASLVARRVHGRIGPYLSLVLAGTFAGIGYVALGSAPGLYLAGAALAVEAAASTLGNVTTMSLRQRLIPPERFGLVNNAFRMCVTGLVPLGALAGGLLAARWGERPTFEIAGALQLAVLAVLARAMRSAVSGAAGTGMADPAVAALELTGSPRDDGEA